MNINLIKNLPVAIACLSSAAIFAGMDMDSRVSQLEAQMKQVRTATSNENFGANTAEGKPMLTDAVGLYLGIGAVYQTATLGGTEYAYTTNQSAASNIPMQGSLKEAGDNWSWGVNAMIGYYVNRDGWDIRLANSYYSNSETDSTSGSIDYEGNIVQVVIPVYTTAFVEDGVGSGVLDAKTNLSITYDLLGLELAREFFVSQYLNLRPNAGLLASWIWTSQKSAYYGGEVLRGDSLYVKEKSNWFGIGPQMGMDTNWILGKGVSIFANTKGSLMYGRFKTSHSEDYSGTNPATIQDVDMSGSIHRFVPYLQAMLGLQFEFSTENNKNHFTLRAGYNTQFFFSENQIIMPDHDAYTGSPSLTFSRTNNNLQTQGLILDASWLF